MSRALQQKNRDLRNVPKIPIWKKRPQNPKISKTNSLLINFLYLLYDLENKLGLMKKMQKQEELVNRIISKLDSLNIKDKKTLESIKKDLKKLI